MGYHKQPNAVGAVATASTERTETGVYPAASEVRVTDAD
jgi:hypothetical protein